MADYQARLEEARRFDRLTEERRRLERINAAFRRRASQMDEPPQYLCVVCGVEVDLCKCENTD